MAQDRIELTEPSFFLAKTRPFEAFCPRKIGGDSFLIENKPLEARFEIEKKVDPTGSTVLMDKN